MPPARPSLWRTDPRTFARLIGGLTVFGIGESLLLLATLGNSPWTVLAQGAAEQVGVGVGAATIAISFLVLAAWVPLAQRPGLGTIANAVVIGLVIGAMAAVFDGPDALVVRILLVVAGIGLVGVGSGIYLTCHLGPGPRDGLMTGLHARTGRSLRLIRASIEVGATAGGALLGGTVGVGTLAFALGVGPAVQLFVGRRGGLREA
jgi:uncharacterized membrane protein YczE